MKVFFATLLALLPMSALAAPATMDSLISFMVYLIVIGLVFWLLRWGIGQVGLPEPFAKVANVVLVVLAVLFLINLLLGLVGSPLVRL